MARLQGRDLADQATQDFLDEAADLGDERLRRYRLYESYYTGELQVPLRDRTREYLDFANLGFNENFCDTVVDVLAERLHIVGFQSSAATDPQVAGEEPTDVFADQITDWWQRCRWDSLEQIATTQTLMKGDGALIVEWNLERGMPAVCFNEPHLVKFAYSEDEPDMLEYAAKTWPSSTVAPANPTGRPVQRLNVYWPDRVEKWFRISADQKGGWARWTDDPGEPWPTPWTGPGGEPLGIPVFHLRHRALGKGNGRSRLRPVIPFQDQLNKAVIDLNELTDNHAFPQRWISGAAGDMELKSVAGNVWKTSAADAKFGQFDPAETAQLLAHVEGILSRLGRRSRTPMHLLTGGTPPSGESLKTAESGLVAVAKACQVELGGAWEQAMLMALRLAAVNDAGPELPDELTLDAQWENPETRSDVQDMQTAEAKQRLGVSKHTLLSELGYDADKEAELRQAEQEAQAEIAARVFDAGGIPE